MQWRYWCHTHTCRWRPGGGFKCKPKHVYQITKSNYMMISLIWLSEGERVRERLLPIDQLHAGNVQNMLYIWCCFTVSPFLTCTLFSPSFLILPLPFSFFLQSKRLFLSPCATHVISFPSLSSNWGFAGPYHLHMHPLRKPPPSNPTCSLPFSHLHFTHLPSNFWDLSKLPFWFN